MEHRINNLLESILISQFQLNSNSNSDIHIHMVYNAPKFIQTLLIICIIEWYRSLEKFVQRLLSAPTSIIDRFRHVGKLILIEVITEVPVVMK